MSSDIGLQLSEISRVYRTDFTIDKVFGTERSRLIRLTDGDQDFAWKTARDYSGTKIPRLVSVYDLLDRHYKDADYVVFPVPTLSQEGSVMDNVSFRSERHLVVEERGSSGENWYHVLCPWVDGDKFDGSPEMASRAGKTLARFHNDGMGIPIGMEDMNHLNPLEAYLLSGKLPPFDFERFEASARRMGGLIDKFLLRTGLLDYYSQARDQLFEEIGELGCSGNDVNVVMNHGDPGPSNFIFTPSGIKVIDPERLRPRSRLDDLFWGSLLFSIDLTHTLGGYAKFFGSFLINGKAVNEDIVRAFYRGYANVSPLTDAEKEYASLYSITEGLNVVHDYLKKRYDQGIDRPRNLWFSIFISLYYLRNRRELDVLVMDVVS